MSDVTITVRGEHQIRMAPERAKVTLSVATDGPDREKVVRATQEAAASVRESLKERSDAGTLADWSSAALSVRAERPWNAEGKRLAPVYHATIGFTATFADVTELSVWVGDVSAREGVSINHVHWHLTPDTRASVERDVATEAIRVAVTRAEAYAAALGRAEVAPVSIADQGLLHHPEAAPAMMRSVTFAADSVGGMEFEPDDIVVSATVEAQFTAR